MFSLFKKDPVKKLRQQYNDKLQEAMNAQRNGDMRAYAELTEEAQSIFQEIERLEAETG